MATIAVGFDFDHTLGRDGSLETKAFYVLAQELGNPIDERDPVWPERIAEFLRRFRTDLITLDDMVIQFVATLGRTGTRADALRYRDICYALVETLVTPMPGARELLAALAARDISTAILTNGWAPLQHHKIARALDYHGPILVSSELGVSKPEAAAFGKLVEALGVERSACWYVGDNPKTDVGGALAAGLHAVWLDEGVSYPRDVPPPDVRITSLLALLDVLPGQPAPAENSHS
jgi:HAD superfamily hydrolase (TIGR01509 family)